MQSKSRFMIRRGLLALLGVALLGGGVFYGVRSRRATWIAKASLEELSQAASKDESDIEVFLKLASRAKEAGEWARAARAYGHACELAPDRLECWIGWARAIYEVTDYPAADAILSDFIKRHPDDPKAYIERAALRRDAKRIDRAWEDINKAVALAPRSGEAWALKGELCIDMATYNDALQTFKTAQKFLPDSPWPVIGIYHSSIELKNYVEAESAARDLRKRFPDQLEGRFYMGEILLLRNAGVDSIDQALSELSKAEIEIQKTDSSDDWNFTLNLLIGRAYYAKKEYKKALGYLSKAIEITPDNPDALYYLGRTYRALGNEVKAAEIMEDHRMVYQNVAFVRKQVALLNLNADDFTTRLRLARWYREKKAYKSAIVHYEELVARGQGGPEVKTELEEVKSKRVDVPVVPEQAKPETNHAPSP